VNPERPYAEELDGGPVPVQNSGESHVKHQNDWLDSIRNQREPSCNLEVAMRAQAIVSLAEISEVAGRSIVFDAKTRRHR
jgi:predicted HTH domain antitoxin